MAAASALARRQVLTVVLGPAIEERDELADVPQLLRHKAKRSEAAAGRDRPRLPCDAAVPIQAATSSSSSASMTGPAASP